MSFIHLSVHSEYSLIDSTVRIKPLVSQAAKLGMPAVALTDQCNLFGLVKFYRAAENAGVKPIAGADVSVAQPDGEEDRLTLLCQNYEGYLSLSRLLTMAFRNRSLKSLPTVDRSWLAEHQHGLIALSGGLNGEVARLLDHGRIDQARDALRWYMATFDGDRYYTAISRLRKADEDRLNDPQIALSIEAGCPVVATNDVRFLSRDEFDAHEARVCIAQGRVLDDRNRPRNYTDQQYLKDPEQMRELFSDLPELIDNAMELGKRLNLELTLGEYSLPAFPVPEGSNEAAHLRQESVRGLEERLRTRGMTPGCERSDYDERLELELEVIISMDFPGYFLIVADFIIWGKENGIPVGPGRGSGAGSLVAYCLGITDLDPLRYDLLFERFLNPERVSMPDFDVDFCMDRRDEVIDYVARRYGREKVSQIITYGSMNAKAVIRDVGRVLGHGYGYVDSVAKLIPPTLGITLDDALKESAELRERVEKEEEVRELMDLAQKLEGLTRNAGKHAGGVVIGRTALTDYSPLYCEAGGEGAVTQFDKDDVEAVGLVKFDFLGLRTLTIIDWALAAINRRRRRDSKDEIDITAIPMDDGATFELLQACKTTAVFQLESRGMKDLIGRLKPESFDDIVALVALYRPGPLDAGMVDTYVDCKHGRQEVVFPHPKLESILKTTYGVILYQEQVMQIAQVLAGYSLGAADILRRAMGKKKPEEMAKQRKIFVDGSTGLGVDAELAESIFDLMEKFAGYGFNKSHSAAYALISYQTAWLKAHYPADFMAAVMSSDMDNTDKVVNFIDDAKSLGLEIQPPSINASRYEFVATDDKTIVYGLGAIKGVGRAAVENMVQVREEGGEFSDLLDFCRRADMSKFNRRVLETLIAAGAFDGVNSNRAALVHNLPRILQVADQESRDRASGQIGLFGAVESNGTTADPVVWEDVPEWPEGERLKGERNTLGLYLTGHPINPFLPYLAPISSARLGELGGFYTGPMSRPEGGGRLPSQPAILAGLILSVRRRETSAFIVLDDQTARVECAVFRGALEEYGSLLVKDEVIVVEGQLSPDEFSGGFSLRASRILTVDQAVAEYARGFHLIVDASLDVAALKTLLRESAGASPVWIKYQNDAASATLRLGESFSVSAAPTLEGAACRLKGVTKAKILYAADLHATE